MKKDRNFLGLFLALMVGLASLVSAQTQPSKSFPNIAIDNFGQMDAHYYRGGQPKKDEFQALSALGVKTVINLRNDPESYEQATVEALGMKYIHIPMSSSSYPKPESINAFLKEINNPANGTVFVHCKGGRHRAGVTGAVYRMTKYHWDFDKAYQEMLNYDFYTRWGHGKMKDFVIDYANKLKGEHSPSNK